MNPIRVGGRLVTKAEVERSQRCELLFSVECAFKSLSSDVSLQSSFSCKPSSTNSFTRLRPPLLPKPNWLTLPWYRARKNPRRLLRRDQKTKFENQEEDLQTTTTTTTSLSSILPSTSRAAARPKDAVPRRLPRQFSEREGWRTRKKRCRCRLNLHLQRITRLRLRWMIPRVSRVMPK